MNYLYIHLLYIQSLESDSCLSVPRATDDSMALDCLVYIAAI